MGPDPQSTLLRAKIVKKYLTPFYALFQLRTVKLRRTSDGKLGISIKGGRDQNLPILVSKVCSNEDDDHLYIGDAIVKGMLKFISNNRFLIRRSHSIFGSFSFNGLLKHFLRVYFCPI